MINMRLKIILFFAFFWSWGLTYSCQTVPTLNNSNLTVSLGECYFIEDINATIYPQNITQNIVVNMTAPDTKTEPYTNTTYNCIPKLENINSSLYFGGNYTNTLYNISIYAPAFPKINQEINLTAGENKTFDEYNLTIHSLPKKYNIYKSIDYGETYSNTDVDINITAPQFPQINENLDINKCGFSKRYDRYNLTVKVPNCIDKTVNLSFDDVYTDDFFKVIIKAPKKQNVKLTLDDGEKYEDNETGINITAKTSFEKYNAFCKNNSVDFVISTWQYFNTTNYTCRTYSYMCLDNLTQYCTYDERVGNPLGIIECQNRVANESMKKVFETQEELSKCNNERAVLLSNTKQTNEATERMYEILLYIVVLFFLFLAGGVFIYGYAKQKAKELR